MPMGGGGVHFDDVPLLEVMYLAFTRMPGESYCRRLRSLLLCLCDVFRELINSLVCLLILFRRSDLRCFRPKQFTSRLACNCMYFCVYMLSQF